MTTKKPEIVIPEKPETPKVRFLSAKRRGRDKMTFICKYKASKSEKVSWFLNGVSVEGYPHFKVDEKYMINKNVIVSSLKVVS